MAQNCGFRGELAALMIFVRNAKKKARKATRALPVAVKAKKKGRKARAASAPVKPAVAAAAPSAQGELENAIDRLVRGRVRAALEKAIEALKGTM